MAMPWCWGGLGGLGQTLPSDTTKPLRGLSVGAACGTEHVGSCSLLSRTLSLSLVSHPAGLLTTVPFLPPRNLSQTLSSILGD